jgi:hypothetical protein
MTAQHFAILNSLVTFAAENIPGGLSIEEREVALAVGRVAASEAPLDSIVGDEPAVRTFERLMPPVPEHREEKLFHHIPMQLNLSDYLITSHLGWAAGYKDLKTGEIRLDIRLSEEASTRLGKDLVEIMDLKAIGFAGIRKKPQEES